MKSRLLVIVIAALVLVIILSGCGKSPAKATATNSVSSGSSTPDVSTSAALTTPERTESAGSTPHEGTSVPTATDAVSGSSAKDPSALAKEYIDTLYSGGVVDQLICSGDAAATQALQQFGGVITGSLEASKATFDVSALTYETANQTADSADVNITGKITTVSKAGTSTTADFPALSLKMTNDSGWKVCSMNHPSTG